MSQEQRQEKKDDFVSIIYSKKNDSPKYFEIKKSKILFFFVGLPTLTLIALILGAVALVNTSPFHLIDNYRQNSLARQSILKSKHLQEKIQMAEEEKRALIKKVETLQGQTKLSASTTAVPAHEKICPPPTSDSQVNINSNSIGLSTLSFFRPIQGQKDKTRPATLSLADFKAIPNRDNLNFQFNIIPALSGDAKLAGHIIVIMKNELAIQVYPMQALYGPGTQLNYTTGEPFATQRFRPVNASFLLPRKSGNTIFTVYIFAKNGDLIHYQSVMLPVKI
ncbi:MAG: hypothetical protein KBD76_03760 [Bacteriovorax sp.]|nr:hypothetical protein [Bacteriovorax sp.]